LAGVEFIPCFSPFLQFPIPSRLATDTYEMIGKDVWIVGMILMPLIDLKFLNELAAGDAGTSNRRY
jgi:hypothetical protein